MLHVCFPERLTSGTCVSANSLENRSLSPLGGGGLFALGFCLKGTLCVVSFSVVGCHPGHSCSMSTFFLSPVHLFPLIESKEGHFPSEVHLDFMLRRCSQYGLNCNCLISQDIKVALTCCLNIL